MDYGTDITFDGMDINPSLNLTKDSTVVLEALSFRLQSDEGSLWYDPTYGFNINGLLKSPILMNGGIGEIKNKIENQCYLETRVEKANVVITGFSAYTKSMQITIKVTLVGGEQNDLVFDITDPSADLSMI